MKFPEGNVVKRWDYEELRVILSELEKESFTGVLAVDGLRAHILVLEGEVVGATMEDGGGEVVWDALLKENSVSAEARRLSKEKTHFLFSWYTDVYGYERIHKDMAREDVLRRVGLHDPDKEKLEEILKREGMDHLFRKERVKE